MQRMISGESQKNEQPVIWLLNHYGGLPGKVRSERTWRIAGALADSGFEVKLMTASHHHIQTEAVPESDIGKEKEIEGGYSHIPVKTRSYSGNGLDRLLNMRDYFVSLKEVFEKGEVERPDLIIASSPHPWAFRFANRARKRSKCVVLLEERDIWPLSLVELAGTPKWHPVVILFGWMARQAYRKCDALVSLLPKSEDFLKSKGLRADRFHCIPNGVGLTSSDDEKVKLPAPVQDWFRAARDDKKLTVVYTGAMGPPNALDQLLDLKKVGEEEKSYRILCIGEGVERERLTREVEVRKCDYLQFEPPVSKAVIGALVKQADIGFISLRPSPIFEYGVSPNKLFEYMDAAMPVVFAVNSGNNPVDEANAGFTVEPYHPEQLDQVLTDLSKSNEQELSAMGERGKAYVREHHHWDVLGKKYSDLCASLLSGKQ